MSGPTRMEGVEHAVQLAVGMTTACAVTTDGKILCWGDNSKGALGNGTTDQPQRPVTVDLGFKAAGVTVNGFEGCAWSTEGHVSCWGRAQTSAGKTSIQKPQSVATIANLAELDLTHNCALLHDHTVTCWKGSPLANASQGKPLSLAPLPAISDAVAIAGTHEYTCILRANGHLNCRAADARAAIPGEPRAASQLEFHDLKKPADVAQVATEAGRMCARLINGAVVCWGIGTSGELGDGQATVREQPATILWPNSAATALPSAHSRVCRSDSDCQWDHAEHPTQCAANPGATQTLAPSSSSGICSCLDYHCTWQHPSTRASNSAACLDFDDCRYDAEKMPTANCRNPGLGCQIPSPGVLPMVLGIAILWPNLA